MQQFSHFCVNTGWTVVNCVDLPHRGVSRREWSAVLCRPPHYCYLHGRNDVLLFSYYWKIAEHVGCLAYRHNCMPFLHAYMLVLHVYMGYETKTFMSYWLPLSWVWSEDTSRTTVCILQGLHLMLGLGKLCTDLCAWDTLSGLSCTIISVDSYVSHL